MRLAGAYRSLLLIIALTAALIAAPGCMKIHIDTVITADGSGTAAIELAMNREVADAVARLGELDSHGDRAGGQDLPAIGELGGERLAAACRAAGVTLASHDFADDEAGVRLDVTLAFLRISDLSHALSALGSDAVARGGEELRIIRTEGGDYLLANMATAGADAGSPQSDPASAADLNRPADPEFLVNFKVLLDHVDELDIRRTITVPGEVISSNAREVEGRTSIWVVNAANMLEEQDTGLDPRITFASEGLSIEAPQAP